MPKRKLKTIRRTITHERKTIERMFATKREADEWYEMMKRRSERVKAGLPGAQKDAPFNQGAALWITLRKVTSDYWQGDERKMRLCFLPAFETKIIRSITKADCENALHGYRLDARLTGATFNRYRACLHTFFEYAIEEGYRETNPVTKIDMIEEEARGVLVSDDDCDEYLGYAAQERARWFLPFIVTGMNTGLRPGELLALSIGDYEAARARGFYEVTKRYQRGIDRVKQGTKGGGKRLVPLNGFVIEVTDSFLAASERKDPATPLFHDEDGTMASPNTLTGIHLRVRKLAGLSDEVRIYDITRHKYGSTVSMQTGNQRLVQKLLGHSTPAITERYSHASEEFLSAASAVVIGRPLAPWEKDGKKGKNGGSHSGGGET